MSRSFPHRRGRDCATSAFRNLLEFHGLCMPEAMAFVIGEGLSFWYAQMDASPFPVILGQNAHVEYTLCRRLGAELKLHVPGNENEAYEPMRRVRQGTPVVVKADPYYLDYCWRDEPDARRDHFGEHVLLISSIDDVRCLVSDIWSDDLETVPIEQMDQARSTTEGYEFLLPQNRWYELSMPARWPAIEEVLPGALCSTAENMLHMRGMFGVSGIRFASTEFPRWIEDNLDRAPETAADSLEIIALRMAQGGEEACFRPIFFDGLREASTLLSNVQLKGIADAIQVPLVSSWNEVIAEIRRIVDDIRSSERDASGAIGRIGGALRKVADLEEDLCNRLLKASTEQSWSSRSV